MKAFSSPKFLSICSFAAIITSTTAEDLPRWAVGTEVGTIGVGASVWYSVSPQFTLNVGHAWLDGSKSFDTDGVDYSGQLDLANTFATFQWHPFDNGVHFSAGAFFTDNYAILLGRPQEGRTFELDGARYPASLIGDIEGTVEWEESTVPYLGIGYSKSPRSEGWGTFVKAGVMFTGSAKATLNATGEFASLPVVQQDLKAEEQELNDVLDRFYVYPVFRVGLMYRF